MKLKLIFSCMKVVMLLYVIHIVLIFWSSAVWGLIYESRNQKLFFFLICGFSSVDFSKIRRFKNIKSVGNNWSFNRIYCTHSIIFKSLNLKTSIKQSQSKYRGSLLHNFTLLPKFLPLEKFKLFWLLQIIFLKKIHKKF